jgi:hypothetical protein
MIEFHTIWIEQCDAPVLGQAERLVAKLGLGEEEGCPGPGIVDDEVGWSGAAAAGRVAALLRSLPFVAA